MSAQLCLVMLRLTTGIRSEKCVVRRFRRCANVIECTYTNLDTGLFISPSGISELDCATTKTDTAESSISIGRESLQVFFVLGALAYFQVPPLGGSHDEKWRSQ